MSRTGGVGLIVVPSRRTTARLVGLILALVGLVGPWPVGDSPYTGSSYFRDTAGRISVSPGKSAAEPLRVGTAQVDLAPAAPVPVAGFIGQVLEPYAGVNSPCSARAITVATPTTSVTILGADLLLIDARLARAVLARAGLPRDQVYFTATHTHGGPGGWGLHPLERLVSGTFDPEQFDRLAGQLAEAVVASRSRLRPAEVAFAQTSLAGLQRNRIIAGGATNDVLSAWIFRATDAIPGPRGLATLVSFGAHATIAHPVPSRLGADYPGAFAAGLARRVDSGLVLFAAGTVGDASPVRPPAPNQQKSAEAYAEALVEALAPLCRSAEFRPTAELINRGVEVDLPPAQVPFGVASLRFSPLAVGWIGHRATYLHAVRVGPAILAGFPGDFSGHLGADLWSGVPVVATSFNGDYAGYLVSRATFRSQSCYETRGMSFFGPDLGDYLTAIMRRCIGPMGNPGP